MNRLFWSVVILLLFCGTSSANEFDAAGVTCMPNAVSIANNWLQTTSNDPELTWDNFFPSPPGPPGGGTIVLQCNIPVDVPNPSNIWIMAQNDTTCSGCSSDTLTVQYIKQNKSTAGVFVIKSIATSTNNGLPETDQTSFSDVWNNTQFTYYVLVTMHRANGNNPQSFRLVSIW
jgi:hypothetical protein